MSDRTFARKKTATSDFSHSSLVSSTTPTLANPTRGFGLPTNNLIQTATDLSTERQEVQSADNGSLEQLTIREKPLSHDISRISFRRPQAKLTVGEPGDHYDQVHTDSTAVQMSKELGAQAFTHGSDVSFGEGKVPGNNELTAHELTHVVRQNGGVVQRKPKGANSQEAVLEKVKEYDEYIKEASKQYGISIEQIRSIIAVESTGKPEATSGAAWGLMQLTKDTWKGMQKARPELKDYDFETYWKDPKVNILFGTATLKAKMGVIGVQSDNPNFAKLAVVGYNAGEGTVKKAIALAKEKGSKNPENDCLQPEYLKPAIKSTKIYSYYLTGQGYTKNPHIKEIAVDPNNKKKKVAVPKEGSTTEQAEETAVDLKYQEVSRYPEKASSYMELQSSSNNTNEVHSSSNDSKESNAVKIAKESNTTKIGTATVTSVHLNVRQGSSTSAQKIGLLSQGEQVDVISKTGEWFSIMYKEQPAFIHSNYTKFTPKSASQKSSDNSHQEKKPESKAETSQVGFKSSDPKGYMTKLYPNLQAKVQVLIENAHKKGLDVWIVQGMRTIEQQNELYAQGRTKGKKGKTVTNAKGGESYHNYGLAVDVVFHGSEPYGESHNWKALGEAGKEAGLEWGGGWKSFPDRPHFQISGLKLSQLKSWYADGGMENVWKNISA